MDGISPQENQQEKKAKVPPRVRPECMSQLGSSSPGAHPDLPDPPALAHPWRPLARGAPAAGGKRLGQGCPTSWQQPREGRAGGEVNV